VEAKTSPVAMKLYCDEMLIRLGHWLRAAGHDTKIAGPGYSDRQILQQSLSTRDRKLLEFRGARDTVLLLHCNLFEDCVVEVTSRLRINWLYRPFSRCLRCNTPLSSATVQQVTDLNAHLKKTVNNIYYCARCDQLYWEGSHVTRMRARLAAFNRYNDFYLR
jgi:uncharacterized protein with PIN domain